MTKLVAPIINYDSKIKMSHFGDGRIPLLKFRKPGLFCQMNAVYKDPGSKNQVLVVVW
jgi:hypothetical protein